MSAHKNPKYGTPELIAALRAHGLETNKPSQLSDAFRFGWVAAIALPEQPTAQPAKTFLQERAQLDQEWSELQNLKAAYAPPVAKVEPTAQPKPSADGPTELWLQLHGDCLDRDLLEPVDYTNDEVTWCWHSIHDSDVRYVRADLAQPTPPPVAGDAAGWQPIETAPKNATEILVTGKDPEGNFGYTLSQHEDMPFRRGFRHRNGAWWATHWMPLPPPPVAAIAAGGKV